MGRVWAGGLELCSCFMELCHFVTFPHGFSDKLTRKEQNRTYWSLVKSRTEPLKASNPKKEARIGTSPLRAWRTPRGGFCLRSDRAPWCLITVCLSPHLRFSQDSSVFSWAPEPNILLTLQGRDLESVNVQHKAHPSLLNLYGESGRKVTAFTFER